MQKLLCLGLDGQPSVEVIEGTLLAWHEVVSYGRRFERERDEPRIANAFRILAGRCRRWPVPAEFLDALPRIEHPRHATPRLESANARQAGAVAIGKIAAGLRISP